MDFKYKCCGEKSNTIIYGQWWNI